MPVDDRKIRKELMIMDGLHKRNSFALKGIAIALIIISHIAGMYDIRYFTPFGGIGVALFLFLSGYGLSESISFKGLKYFWIKRVVAVWLPYVFVEGIMTIVIRKFYFKEFLFNILLISPRRTEIWYLQYLGGCYLLFWCIYKYIGEKYRMSVLFVLSLILLFVLPEIAAEQALSFWLGCACSKRKELFVWLEKKSIAIMCLLIGVVALAVKQFDVVRSAPQIIINLVQLTIKLPSALFLIAFVNGMLKFIKCRWFGWVGKISYELYLIHINLLFMINQKITNLILFIVLICISSISLHVILGRMEKILLKKCC